MKILKIKSTITEMKDLPDGLKINWIFQKKKKKTQWTYKQMNTIIQTQDQRL